MPNAVTGGGNVGGQAAHVTNSLAAAQAAVMVPSPAEQVTDDLISPKYDDEEEASDEDESDDTVYECPGLAAGSTGMVVANPFFLQGAPDSPLPATASSVDGLSQPLQGLQGLRSLPPPPISPKPIDSQSSIFHHGIKGYNWEFLGMRSEKKKRPALHYTIE